MLAGATVLGNWASLNGTLDLIATRRSTFQTSALQGIQVQAQGHRPKARAALIQIVHAVATTIEAAGVLVILGASVASCVAFAREGLQGTWAAAYVHTRANLGRGILLGLEFLVAADIIDTVAVTPTFESLGVLAMIIMIRTLLSFALQVEIDGQWPWRRREAGPDGKCLGD